MTPKSIHESDVGTKVFHRLLDRCYIKISSKVIGVVAIAILTAICCSRGIDLVNSWNGWAPPSYVWASKDSETFLKLDFMQEHNLHIGNSLAMRIYPLVHTLFGIDPEITQYIFIFVTALLYAASLWMLTSTLIPRVSHVVLWLVVGMALLTEAANGDLARFGQANLSLGQAYGFAIPLQVITLALSLRGRLLSAGAVLGLLACVHLTLGAITTAIVAVMLFWQPMVRRDWRFWTAGCIVMTCTLAWAFGIVDVGENYERIETNAWVLWERFSNYHWFPFDNGIFTREHYFGLTPFLALAILASCCSFAEMPTPTVRRRWIVGLASSAIITIIGLVVSLYPVSQQLVMLALHRASGITLLLLLPMAVLGLVRFMERDNALSGAIAAMLIAGPFLGTKGIPLFPVLLLAAFRFVSRGQDELLRWQRRLVFTLSATVVGYTLFLIYAGHASVGDVAFVGLCKAWLAAGAFFIIKIVLLLSGRWKPYPECVARTVIMIFIVVFLWHGVDRNWQLHPKVPQAEAKAYLATQKWARENTSRHALFMPDPAHAYGWKDYSRRASYGNIRDWTHSVIAYRSDMAKFAEGIRRARRLGVDPETYLARSVASSSVYPGCAEYNRMLQDIRSAYYGLSGVELLNLARDERIDYFVFELKYTNVLQLKPVYQNTHFVICEPVLKKKRIVAETTFPITFPASPVSCDELIGTGANRYGWANRGFRGMIWVNRADSEIPTLRLVAGKPDQKGEHVLQLSPKADSEKGFPVIEGSQAINFKCEMRSINATNSVERVQLQMEVLSSKEGWNYHPKKIDVGKDWCHYEVVVSIMSNVAGVYPTVIWTPAVEGSALELRSPVLRWIGFVHMAPVKLQSSANRSSGQDG